MPREMLTDELSIRYSTISELDSNRLCEFGLTTAHLSIRRVLNVGLPITVSHARLEVWKVFVKDVFYPPETACCECSNVVYYWCSIT
jgi:hypothetical protein